MSKPKKGILSAVANTGMIVLISAFAVGMIIFCLLTGKNPVYSP